MWKHQQRRQEQQQPPKKDNTRITRSLGNWLTKSFVICFLNSLVYFAVCLRCWTACAGAPTKLPMLVMLPSRVAFAIRAPRTRGTRIGHLVNPYDRPSTWTHGECMDPNWGVVGCGRRGPWRRNEGPTWKSRQHARVGARNSDVS